MSPMFLGGLTARAMKLQNDLKSNSKFIEVYPKMSARSLRLKNYFEMDVDACLKELETKFDIKIMCQKQDHHSIDAVLAWQTGVRYFQDKANSEGNKAEGFIYY
jgi:predicted nuclease with RNAse H fold